jgi:hypothetical protein
MLCHVVLGTTCGSLTVGKGDIDQTSLWNLSTVKEFRWSRILARNEHKGTANVGLESSFR